MVRDLPPLRRRLSPGSQRWPPDAIRIAFDELRASSRDRSDPQTDWARNQPCGWPMSTIQMMPNWSTHMPNSSPHICFSRGTDTVPPAESFSQ